MSRKQTGRVGRQKDAKSRKPGRPSDNIPRRKLTLHLPEVLAEKLDDYAYWEGVPVSRALAQLMVQFFKKHPVTPRPEPMDLKAELEKLE